MKFLDTSLRRCLNEPSQNSLSGIYINNVSSRNPYLYMQYETLRAIRNLRGAIRKKSIQLYHTLNRIKNIQYQFFYLIYKK